jgi:hypothetical protein
MVRRGKTNRFGILTIERYQLWLLLRSKEKQNVLNSPDGNDILFLCKRKRYNVQREHKSKERNYCASN